MKKIAALVLYVFILLTALPCCGGEAEVTDEMIGQKTQIYLNMDIEAIVDMIRVHSMDEEAIENMRNIHRMANDGTLGAYLRGGIESAADSVELSLPEPLLQSEGSILDIAKKYYDRHSNALQSDLRGEFSRDVGAASFDGTHDNDVKADELCTIAAAIAILQGDGNFAVAAAAAAVGWSQNYPHAAATLASVLEVAGFINDGARLDDAKKLAEYAVSLDKNDVSSYLTLARIQCRIGDLDAALEAVNAALAIQPDNNAALKLKLEILAKRGGGFLAAQGPKIGRDLKENDGELSKRATEQEKETEGQKWADLEESEEQIQHRLDSLYKLKPITPADMMELLYPFESEKIRQAINTVSAKDKAMLTNSFPIFPNALFRTSEVVFGSDESWLGIKRRSLMHEYAEWVSQQIKIIKSDVQKTSSQARAARAQRGMYPSHNLDTAADYMREYNHQVYWAGKIAYNAYLYRINKKYLDMRNEIEITRMRKYDEAHDLFLRESEAAWALPSPADSTAGIAARIKFEVTVNTITDIYFKEFMTLFTRFYNNVVKASEEYWENMLPFARATQYPEENVVAMYNDIQQKVWGHFLDLPGFGTNTPGYYIDSSAKDQVEAEKALEALLELMSQQPVKYENVANAIVISIAFGPIELKLGTTKVELEYVAGVAGRVAFDWKTDQLEMGVGAGGRIAKLGMQSSIDQDMASAGIEAKTYINVVFQTRKGVLSTAELCDVYVSAEAKASANAARMKAEAGIVGRVSFMGGETALTAAAKKDVAGFTVELEKEIISRK